jgi:peptide/nickel transport system substrate-binding protein
VVRARVSRRRFLIGAGAVTAIGAGGGLLVACTPPAPTGGTATPAPTSAVKKGGTVIEGGTVDPQSFNPLLATTGTTQIITGLLWEPLLDIDAKNELVPALAEAVPTPTDAKTYTFKLRSGLKWSDGTPLTSADVAFTFKLIFDPAYKEFSSFLRGQAEQLIASVDAPDPQTVTLVAKSPNAAFLATYGVIRILPKHIIGTLAAKELNTADFNNAPPVASGPFKFGAWDKGAQVRLVRNESYWRGQTNIDTYIRKVLGSDDKVATQLKLGEVHMGKIAPTDQPTIESDANIQAIRYTSRAYWFYATQLGHKVLSDKSVRQALRWAIDADRIKKVAFLDKGEVAATHIPSWNWGSDKNPATKYTLDQNKAKQLLDTAGWKAGASGIREKDGTPIKFSISVGTGSTEANLISQVLQEQWKAIGADVEIKQVNAQQLVADVVQKHAFEVWVANVSQSQDPDFISQFYHSSNAKPGGVNFSDYKNPTVDKLLEDARATTDVTKRKDMYREIQRILLDELPLAPLVLPVDTMAIQKRVQNVPYTLFADQGNRPWMKDVWVTDGK